MGRVEVQGGYSKVEHKYIWDDVRMCDLRFTMRDGGFIMGMGRDGREGGVG